MKPFDLELAKAGHPVCIRDGRKARIICFDKKDSDFPIIALLDFGNYEAVATYTLEGRFMWREESNKDLFMAPTKREGWINIYKTSFGSIYTGVDVYKTRQDALDQNNNNELINTVKIEWEE